MTLHLLAVASCHDRARDGRETEDDENKTEDDEDKTEDDENKTEDDEDKTEEKKNGREESGFMSEEKKSMREVNEDKTEVIVIGLVVILFALVFIVFVLGFVSPDLVFNHLVFTFIIFSLALVVIGPGVIIFAADISLTAPRGASVGRRLVPTADRPEPSTRVIGASSAPVRLAPDDRVVVQVAALPIGPEAAQRSLAEAKAAPRTVRRR